MSVGLRPGVVRAVHRAGISEDEHGRPVEVRRLGESRELRQGQDAMPVRAMRLVDARKGWGSPWVGYEAGASPRTVSLLLGTVLGSWQASAHCVLPVG